MSQLNTQSVDKHKMFICFQVMLIWNVEFQKSNNVGVTGTERQFYVEKTNMPQSIFREISYFIAYKKFIEKQTS